MSRKYKFYDSTYPHFVSFAVVNWIDLFTRRIYFEVILDSLRYCIEHKSLIVNAWCIMSNHVHLIIRSETNELADIMRDMKKFTSAELIRQIEQHPQESRRAWLLWMFRRAGERNGNNKKYQLWQQHNQPTQLDSSEKLKQRLDYLHMNPVKAGFVEEPKDWLYSSAKTYAGIDGMLELELIELP